MRYLLGAAAVALTFPVAISEASAATYVASRKIGNAFLNIRIDTDGKTGRLLEPNLIDWRISVKRGAETFELNGPLSGDNSEIFVGGNNFTATAEHIFFDYDSLNRSFVTFLEGSSFPSAYGFQSAGVDNAPSEIYRFGPDVSATFAARSDFAIIASAVPEPGSWALMIGGFAAAGLALRPRQRERAARA